MALNNGSGAIPALGFGTLIPDPIATRTATKAAMETGFRQLDASERYRNEKEVGEAMQEVFKAGKIKREECLSPQRSGITIIVLNASNPPSRPVSRDSNSTTPTLSHPHPLCLPTWRRTGPEGCERQRDL